MKIINSVRVFPAEGWIRQILVTRKEIRQYGTISSDAPEGLPSEKIIILVRMLRKDLNKRTIFITVDDGVQDDIESVIQNAMINACQYSLLQI